MAQNKEKVVLSEPQKISALNYINTHKEFLFGKAKCGVQKINQTQSRHKFLDWCEKEKIPYKTWKKFETQSNQWKCSAAKNQRQRKNKTGSQPIPLRK